HLLRRAFRTAAADAADRVLRKFLLLAADELAAGLELVTGEQVADVVGEAADLAELAVVHGIKANLGLLADDFLHRIRQRRKVVAVLYIALAKEAVEARGLREGAHMAGQDAVGAALHVTALPFERAGGSGKCKKNAGELARHLAMDPVAAG